MIGLNVMIDVLLDIGLIKKSCIESSTVVCIGCWVWVGCVGGRVGRACG